MKKAKLILVPLIALIFLGCTGTSYVKLNPVPVVECTDIDGDGYHAEGAECGPVDCDDNDEFVNTNMIEICGDGIDNNCDGEIDVNCGSQNCPDADGDGYKNFLCGGDDCADGDSAIHPGALEHCNGIDDDCDPGTADGLGEPWFGSTCDGDDADLCEEGEYICELGVPTCTDFSENNLEVCNLEDDDCDPSTPDGKDEDWFGIACDGSDEDGCEDGVFICASGEQLCNDDPESRVEICNGIDDTCDGIVPLDEIDNDNDHYVECESWEGPTTDIYAGGDCNDVNAVISPGAIDICGNQIDENCDGVLNMEDNDQDGFLDEDCGTGNDCDDDDPNVHPGADEICDGKDSDCSGSIPGIEADADADGIMICEDDCDDNDPERFPGNPEECDGIDNDCDNVVPENETDADADGVMICEDDCDDSDPARFPENLEICDGKDNDCAGPIALDEIDDDSDGYVECEDWVGNDNEIYGGGDCEDDDPDVFPEQSEDCNNNKDDNCDTLKDCEDLECSLNTSDIGGFGCATYYKDADGDGFGRTSDSKCICSSDSVNNYDTEQNNDCDDNDSALFPDNQEICDGKDNDCNNVLPANEVDADGDGVMVCENDCDDNDSVRFPGNPEQCDGKDNDCNQVVPANENNIDEDEFMVCEGDCNDFSGDSYPGAEELCDGEDNDCNGSAGNDEVDNDGDGFMICEEDCRDRNPNANPGVQEDCSTNIDDNCNGEINEENSQGCTDYYKDSDGDGYGLTNDKKCLCAPLEEYNTEQNNDCNDTDPEINPDADEICDNVDNDCDTVIDDIDEDGDGYIDENCGGNDCDDSNFNINPGISEHIDQGNCEDGIDNDCDSLVDFREQDCTGCNKFIFPGDNIQQAINQLDDGCEIILTAGDYEISTSIVIPTYKEDITLRAYEVEGVSSGVTIELKNDSEIIKTCVDYSDFAIKGLEIKGGGIVVQACSHNTILIDSNTMDGSKIEIDFDNKDETDFSLIEYSDVTISNNTNLHSNIKVEFSGIGYYGEGDSRTKNTVIIENNDISDISDDDGIIINFLATGDTTPPNLNDNEITIINNTITNIGGSGIDVLFDNKGEGYNNNSNVKHNIIQIENNTIQDNSTNGLFVYLKNYSDSSSRVITENNSFIILDNTIFNNFAEGIYLKLKNITEDFDSDSGATKDNVFNIKNNIIEDNSDGIYVDIIGDNSPGDSLMENNSVEIFSNTIKNSQFLTKQRHGVVVKSRETYESSGSDGYNEVILYNNTIHKHPDIGFLYDAEWDTRDFIKLYNNTIHSNKRNIQIYRNANDMIDLKNNLITNSGINGGFFLNEFDEYGDIFMSNGFNNNYNDKDIWDWDGKTWIKVDDYNFSENNMECNPTYIDIEEDLRLGSDSDCIDQGDNSILPDMDDFDKDGNPRKCNGIIDLGAYEYCVE